MLEVGRRSRQRSLPLADGIVGLGWRTCSAAELEDDVSNLAGHGRERRVRGVQGVHRGGVGGKAASASVMNRCGRAGRIVMSWMHIT